MTAALEAAGHRVCYYENIEGGHAGAADNEQVAFKSALTYSFLWRMLAAPQPPGPRRAIGSSTCQRPNASNSPCWRPG